MHEDLLHKDTTDKIIKAFYYVYNKLGYGFLEKVGLLLSFGPEPEFRRKVFSNARKRIQRT